MPWLAAHFRGEMSLEDAAALAKRDTRHYAKRQFTWINNQLDARWMRVSAASLDERAEAVLALVQEKSV